MKTGLLLGAGFSFDLGMQLASELTEDFSGLYNDAVANRLALAMSAWRPYGKDRPINKNAIINGWGLEHAYRQGKISQDLYEASCGDT